MTYAIVGPRTWTPGHLDSQLPAADVVLSTEVLDRVDQIVPPSGTINQDDNMSFAPTLTSAVRRR